MSASAWRTMSTVCDAISTASVASRTASSALPAMAATCALGGSPQDLGLDVVGVGQLSRQRRRRRRAIEVAERRRARARGGRRSSTGSSARRSPRGREVAAQEAPRPPPDRPRGARLEPTRSTSSGRSHARSELDEHRPASRRQVPGDRRTRRPWPSSTAWTPRIIASALPVAGDLGASSSQLADASSTGVGPVQRGDRVADRAARRDARGLRSGGRRR